MTRDKSQPKQNFLVALSVDVAVQVLAINESDAEEIAQRIVQANWRMLRERHGDASLRTCSVDALDEEDEG